MWKREWWIATVCDMVELKMFSWIYCKIIKRFCIGFLLYWREEWATHRVKQAPLNFLSLNSFQFMNVKILINWCNVLLYIACHLMLIILTRWTKQCDRTWTFSDTTNSNPAHDESLILSVLWAKMCIVNMEFLMSYFAQFWILKYPDS